MRPYDVRSENDNLAMTSDNHPQDAERWSILNFADRVSLHAPTGTDWVGWVEIPRDQFNAIVDWYIKDQAAPADHVVGSDKPTKRQIEAAIDAYEKGSYLNDEQVLVSVIAIVSAALSAPEAEG